ncbi:MAG: hypothetical protein J2P18_15530 [Nocardia sp.]|nr:hypothetical protein [Nocardia sp.]
MNQMLLEHPATGDQMPAARRSTGAESAGDCSIEPRELTYSRARAIFHAHDRHFRCRQWIAAAAYLSAGLDDE